MSKFTNATLPDFKLIYRKSAYIKEPKLIYDQFRFFVRQFRFMYQRARYGYSEYDEWSLYDYLLSFLPEAIRRQKESIGYPSEFVQYGEEEGVEMWHQILEDIASGLEAGRDFAEMENYEDFYEGTPEEVSEKRHNMFMGTREGDRVRLLNNEEVGLVFDRDKWNDLQMEREYKFDRAFDLLHKHFFSLWN